MSRFLSSFSNSSEIDSRGPSEMSGSPAPLSPAVVQEIETVLSAYSDIIIVQYTTVSSLILLVWEYVITFDDECQYFWSSSISLTSVLYFFNRYANILFRLVNTVLWLIPHKSYKVCYYWVKYVQVGTSTMSLFAAELVLILRIWAIYGKSTKVLVVTSTLWLLTSVASSAVLGAQSEHAFGSNEPLPGLFFCVLASPINYLYAFWIPNVVFEGFAFIMVGYKAFTHSQAASGSKVLARMSLMKIILRDSFAYVIVMFCCALANAMLYRFGRPGLYDTAQGPTVAVFAMLVTRMLTNLRKAGKRPAGHSTHTGSRALSSLQFDAQNDGGPSYTGQEHFESQDVVTRETTGTAVEEVELQDISSRGNTV